MLKRLEKWLQGNGPYILSLLMNLWGGMVCLAAMWKIKSGWTFILLAFSVTVNLMQAGAMVQRLRFPNFLKWRYIALRTEQYGEPEVGLMHPPETAPAAKPVVH